MGMPDYRIETVWLSFKPGPGGSSQSCGIRFAEATKMPMCGERSRTYWAFCNTVNRRKLYHNFNHIRVRSFILSGAPFCYHSE